MSEGSGNQVRLKPWNQRKRKAMGFPNGLTDVPPREVARQLPLFEETPDRPERSKPARMVPLIDQIHRLMHLWKEGDVVRVDDYLESSGLRHHAVFGPLLQALIELAPAGSEERSILESISNHAAARGVRLDRRQQRLPGTQTNEVEQ